MNAQNDPEFPALEAYVKSVIGDQPKPMTSEQLKKLSDEVHERVEETHAEVMATVAKLKKENQPKPASCEWTAESLGVMMGLSAGWASQLARVADAHNAALAAERAKREGIENRLGVAFDHMVHDYQQQLAADREKNWIRAEDNPGYNRYE